jgi:hypothetical protein
MHSVWAETQQGTIRAVAVVAIGAAGVRVKLNSTDPEQAVTQAVEAVPVTPRATLRYLYTLKDSSQVQGH